MYIVYLENNESKIMKLPNIVAVYDSQGKIQTFKNGLTNNGVEFPPLIDNIGFSANGVDFSNLESITEVPIDVIYYDNNKRIDRKKNTNTKKNENNKKAGEFFINQSYKNVIDNVIKKYDKLVHFYNHNNDVKYIDDIENNINFLKNDTIIKNFKDYFDNYKIVEITIDNNNVNKTFFDENVNNIIESFKEIIEKIKNNRR